jgi:23S rRNA pseudouridine1911/1915/1917 synthase
MLAALSFRRQALHAARLGFIHPVSGALIALSSDLPADMERLIVDLRNNS